MRCRWCPSLRLEAARAGGRQGGSLAGSKGRNGGGFIDQSQHLEWEANAAPPELPLLRLKTARLFCAQVPLPPYGRKKPVHTFSFLTNKTCALLRGDFPFFLLLAEPLPRRPALCSVRKGCRAASLVHSSCWWALLMSATSCLSFSASAPFPLSPVSQSPGIALGRHVAPAGPRGGRARSGFRGIAAVC